MYKTKGAADRAYKGYRFYKHQGESLENMSELWRRLFNYRIKLYRIWLSHYEKAIEEGLPALAYAWIMFRRDWKSGYSGRWIKRK